MPQYLLSVHSVEGAPSMTEEEMQQSWKEIQVLNQEIRDAGIWVLAGALNGADAAKVVHVSDDDVLVTDGPFAESKEQIGGFYIIDAADLDGALSWATKASAAVRKPIEVREFRDSEG